jgi:hypothetical protein
MPTTWKMSPILRLKRIESKIAVENVLRGDMTEPCHIWLGGKSGEGYGQIEIDGKICRVYRVIWALNNGEIFEGMVLHHRCENPSCVNINHLKLMTTEEHSSHHNTGRLHTDEFKEFMREKMTGNTHGVGHLHTDEWKKQRSERYKGASNPNFGRNWSQEKKDKMSRIKLAQAQQKQGVE